MLLESLNYYIWHVNGNAIKHVIPTVCKSSPNFHRLCV